MPAYASCDWPIVYIRGFAMTQGEIDETTADPFCGFNLGSTAYRAALEKTAPPKKFLFESPLVRLQSDYGYCDVYENGIDFTDSDWDRPVQRKSVVIYRYYDPASKMFGAGTTPPITEFASGLSDLILALRDRVCADPANEVTPDQFRCYLVAHSMGGLVARAFLQNPALSKPEARACVDKFFTYATPHNGIELGGINVPRWLSLDEISNFNRDEMARYLDLGDLYGRTKRVDWLPERRFSSRKVFCMIGSNRGDYEAAAGLSRTFVGHGSDGLVRVENAAVWGVDDDGQEAAPTAMAFCYRSHSGTYGIVNSEESYQNLVRFLFGDVRVDVWLDIDDVSVPQELEQQDADGKVDALYQIELLAAPRGARWYLTRRIAEEDSVAVRKHSEIKRGDANACRIFLSTVFLANRFRVANRQTLAYGLTLGIRAPDYQVDKRFWPDRHYEGGYLFKDSMAIELLPPNEDGSDWRIRYDWQSDNVGQSETPVDHHRLANGAAEVIIPFATSDATPPRSPGIAGKLRFVISQWNTTADAAAPSPRMEIQ